MIGLETALIIGTVISAVGAGVSAVSQYSQANYQAAMSRNSATYARQMAIRNMTMAQYQADATRKAGQEQAGLIRERARKMLGKQLAGYGASGVDIEGSPLEFMSETMGEYERDAHNTILNANFSAWRTTEAGTSSLLQGNAEADRYESEAKVYDSRGPMALAGGLFQVGSSILTGYGRYQNANKYGGSYDYEVA